jgi:hypothetical protein
MANYGQYNQVTAIFQEPKTSEGSDMALSLSLARKWRCMPGPEVPWVWGTSSLVLGRLKKDLRGVQMTRARHERGGGRFPLLGPARGTVGLPRHVLGLLELDMGDHQKQK